MIVVKIGGSVVENLHESFVEDLKEQMDEGGVVLVHGGGRQITKVAERLDKPQVFIRSPKGFQSRYTDWETLEILVMVLAGLVNKMVVAELQRAGVKAVGLSGVDGGLIRAERKRRLLILDERGRRRFIEGDYSGRIVQTNTQLLLQLLEEGYLPVVAPVALGVDGTPLNVNGDRAAAHIAASLGAEALVFLTDVEAVLLDGKPLRRILAGQVAEILPKIGAGMSTKLYAAAEAVSLGAKRAVISSGLVEKPITVALRGGGSVIEGA